MIEMFHDHPGWFCFGMILAAGVAVRLAVIGTCLVIGWRNS